MNKSLTRSIGFWLLLVLSLAATAVGGWLISGQLGTMTSTLTDGTATGVEVYVGQSLVVVGAAILGAGIIGLLLTLALTAVRALIPTPTPVVVEPIDWTATDGVDPATEVTPEPALDRVEATTAEAANTASESDADARDDATGDDQNGSSGSTATATKINVK